MADAPQNHAREERAYDTDRREFAGSRPAGVKMAAERRMGMNYDMKLGGSTFQQAVEDFDIQMTGLLGRMRKQKICEGSVTLKINVTLTEEYPYSEDGTPQEVFVPTFEHEVQSCLSMKDKRKGKIEEDMVLTIGPDGLPRLVSRDTDNLFDMVEEEREGLSDGRQGAAGAGG